MPKDSHNRLEMLQPSMNIMKSIVGSVMKSGFNGIFLVASNPVDIMTYYVWRLSGLPTVIDKTGAREIVEIKLKEDEEEALKKSASVLIPFYKELL